MSEPSADGMDLTSTLRCTDCGAVMSPAEAYGKQRDTCPNPSCRGELTLTDKGAETLWESIKGRYLDTGMDRGDESRSDGTERSHFDTDRDWDFSRLGNWIQDNLDVDHRTATRMADAALDVKYGEAGDANE